MNQFFEFNEKQFLNRAHISSVALWFEGKGGSPEVVIDMIGGKNWRKIFDTEEEACEFIKEATNGN